MSLIHHLYSENRSKGTTTDFMLNFRCPSNHNRISLASCCIPRSFYGVETGHNTFRLDLITYTIEAGNYSVDTFLSAVNTAISGNGVMTFTRKTGKYIITTLASQLIFPASSKLQNMFGFPSDTISVNGVGGVITSSIVVNLSGLSTVYITTNLVNSGKGDGYDNTLSTIFVNNSVDFSNIVWYNPQIEHTALPLNLSNAKQTTMINYDINLKILDELGNTVDTNGQDIRLVLSTWRDNDIYSLLKNYIGVRLSEIENGLIRSEK